jgi:uncharacterized membrane protein YgcG
MRRALAAALLLLMLALPANAESPRVVDRAELLTAAEMLALEQRCGEIAGRYRMDVALLTIDGTGGEELTEFCRQYYNEAGYGYGARSDGVLFVVDIGAGNWALHLKGAARELFGEPAKAAVVRGAEAHLAAKEYPAALAQFLEDIDAFLASSVPVREEQPSGAPDVVFLLALAAALALGASLIHGILERAKERRQLRR